VFTDGTVIRQGVGVVIAFLHAGTKLDSFIGRSELSMAGWMGSTFPRGPGVDRRPCESPGYIRKNGISLQLDTDGRNAHVLDRLLAEKLGDRVVMEVKGPLSLYGRMLGREIDAEEVKKSIGLVTRFPEYQFRTTVRPCCPEGGDPETGYLTPDEVAETAKLIQETTGSYKHPYVLRVFDAESFSDERLKSIGN